MTLKNLVLMVVFLTMAEPYSHAGVSRADQPILTREQKCHFSAPDCRHIQCRIYDNRVEFEDLSYEIGLIEIRPIKLKDDLSPFIAKAASGSLKQSNWNPERPVRYFDFAYRYAGTEIETIVLHKDNDISTSNQSAAADDLRQTLDRLCR
jgi:hypothetical protein